MNMSAYEHEPKFSAFSQVHGLPFTPYVHFDKAAQKERRSLVVALVNQVWPTDRLNEYKV